MNFIRRLMILIPLLMGPMASFAQGLDPAKIDQALGRSGQKFGNVYKVGFPRTDLNVLVHGLAIKPGLALGSWAAFSGTDDIAMVMGDLVLLQNEVDPVMKKLRAAGFEITAVHNHLLEEAPRIMYMHYMGHGPAVKLAESLCAALAVSKTPLGKPAPPPAVTSAPPAWVKMVEDTVGRKGGFNGGVLSFGVPRAEAVTMGGMTVTPSEGVAESINFQEAGTGKVATTGDFVLTGGGSESGDLGAGSTPNFRDCAAQPYAHRGTAALLHALLGCGHSWIGRGRNQGGFEPCRNEIGSD